MQRPLVNYIVLLASMVFEGTSWLIALRDFRAHKGELGYFQAFRRSKDPTTFTVLFEDSAALLGLVIALAGVGAAQWLAMPRLDGVASIAHRYRACHLLAVAGARNQGPVDRRGRASAGARRDPAHRRRAIRTCARPTAC